MFLPKWSKVAIYYFTSLFKTTAIMLPLGDFSPHIQEISLLRVSGHMESSCDSWKNLFRYCSEQMDIDCYYTTIPPTLGQYPDISISMNEVFDLQEF